MKCLKKKTRKHKGRRHRKRYRTSRNTKRRGGGDPVYVSAFKAGSPWREKQKIDDAYKEKKARINATYEENRVRIEGEYQQEIENLEKKNKEAIEEWRTRHPEAGHFDNEGGMPTPRTLGRIKDLDEDESRMETSRGPPRGSSWRSWRTPQFFKRNSSSSSGAVHPKD